MNTPYSEFIRSENVPCYITSYITCFHIHIHVLRGVTLTSSECSVSFSDYLVLLTSFVPDIFSWNRFCWPIALIIMNRCWSYTIVRSNFTLSDACWPKGRFGKSTASLMIFHAYLMSASLACSVTMANLITNLSLIRAGTMNSLPELLICSSSSSVGLLKP